MRLAAVPLAAAAAVWSILAGATPSRSEVMALPPGQAAEALLRQISGRFVEMIGQEEDDGGPVLLTFATAPESLGESGICRARLLMFRLVRSENPAEPASVADVDTEDAYKVVGEAQPMRPTGEAERAAQSRPCTNAGPVLAREQYGSLAREYFTHAGSGHPWMAVAALQGAIAQARAGEFGDVHCDPHLGDCSDPRARLARLDLADLIRLQMAHEGGTLRFHLTATFRPANPNPAARPIQLTMALEAMAVPHGPVIFTYGRAAFAPGLYL